jgi:hemerythrin-like domain-containing protein
MAKKLNMEDIDWSTVRKVVIECLEETVDKIYQHIDKNKNDFEKGRYYIDKFNAEIERLKKEKQSDYPRFAMPVLHPNRSGIG